ncbi:unnamed protein product [Parnassius mnemosyne]|uniref:Integrase zinc-binding domain-containing protein n=1 Tax=Parnassius mnemosyne TaxID=213953 RepID=A0AAV1L568_9NEOP
MVVPKAKVPDVLQLYHSGCSGGHLGVKRTLLKIRERFYWVHCRDDVDDWCRKCKSCAAVKGPQIRSRGALKHALHIQPFLLSYRSAVHESTSVTPAFANFGRELRLPADLITGIPPCK